MAGEPPDPKPTRMRVAYWGGMVLCMAMIALFFGLGGTPKGPIYDTVLIILIAGGARLWGLGEGFMEVTTAIDGELRNEGD